MKKALLLAAIVLLCAVTHRAQTTTFVPNCGGADDTARFTSLITKIGANTGTIRLPYKDGTRCAVGNLTIPANVTIDNSDGTGISVNAGATLLVLGPVVSPVGKQTFFGPGTISFAGNATIGSAGQVLTSGGDGTAEWANATGGSGGGGITTGSGATVLQTGPTIIGASLTGNTTASSINGLSITPTTGGTLTIANGKTLTTNNSLTFNGTDGTQMVLGQPLTIGGSGGVTLTGSGTLNFGGFTGTLPANGTFALGADTVSVSSTNNNSTALHSHAVLSSSNPGPAASLLATNALGTLQLEKLGIGTAPTQSLDVAGNVFLNAPTANFFMKDLSTGWQASSTTVINPQVNNSIRSTNFTSGLVGWSINATGNAEFANLDVRGAIHTSVLVYNALQATAGTLGVFKSAAKLRTDATVPAGPTYGTTTISIDVVDADGLTHAASQLFVVNDILRLKEGLTGDTWFRVASVSDQSSFWRYTATIMAGSANVTYRAGLGVADYGQSGQGFIELTADRTNAPYEQMATHSGTFTSLNSAGTLNVTPRLRIGNLNGSYGYNADTYGFAAGERSAGQSWISVDTANGVRIGNNTTVLAQVDASGNAFFTGSITASSGTIAGWSIANNRLSSGVVSVASSFDAPLTGAMAWFGQSANGYRGMAVRDASNREIDVIANNGSIFPYFQVSDGTRTRFVAGGLNNVWGAEGSVNSMGVKIYDSTGGLLAQFHDLANTIAGWNITTTRMSAGSGSTTVGMDATVTGGDDVRIFAGSATPAAAPFRVTEAGALTATNATITGDITATSGSFTGSITSSAGSIGGWSITANRLSNGSGTNTVGLDSTVTGGDDVRIFAGNSTPSSAPFRVTEAGALTATNANITGAVTATSGSFTGTVTASSGSIGGWTINSAKISSTGIDINSGGSAGLAFGSTPPTSASSGTGIWQDRTGLYGLASGVVQVKLDASTGGIVAGAGTTVLDSKGISIFDGADDQVDSIKFYNASFSSTWPNYIAQLASNVVLNATFTSLATKQPTGITNESAVTNIMSLSDAFIGDASISLRSYGTTHATLASKRVIQTNADALIVTTGTVSSPIDPITSVLLDVRADNIRIATAKTPASASAACTQGVIAWDSSFVYVCVATNTWKRSAISTW